MKLSWLNTSEAHINNTSIYMIWQYESMHKVKRELERQWIYRKHKKFVSRFEPLLYVPAFTQKDFHYL